MNLQRILFVHLYATSHLGGFETGENDFEIFFQKPLLPDRKALHQGSTLADLPFHSSKDNLWKTTAQWPRVPWGCSVVGYSFSLGWGKSKMEFCALLLTPQSWGRQGLDLGGMSGSFWSGSLGRCGSLRRLQGFPALCLSGNATRWASPTISRYFLLPESGNLETCKKSFHGLQ